MALWPYCHSALANSSPLNHPNSALCTKKEQGPFFLCLCLCLFNLFYAYHTSVNQALDEPPNSVRRWNVLPYDNQFGYPCCRGRL